MPAAGAVVAEQPASALLPLAPMAARHGLDLKAKRLWAGIASAVAGLVYVLALAALVRMPGNDLGEPLFLLGTLVIAFLRWHERSRAGRRSSACRLRRHQRPNS